MLMEESITLIGISTAFFSIILIISFIKNSLIFLGYYSRIFCHFSAHTFTLIFHCLILLFLELNFIKNSLIFLGYYSIDISRIRAVGKGENNPIADNNSFDGRVKNRRVEFQLDD